jgi:hypothetical protein
LLALTAATATQQPKDRDACSFRVAESATKPSITGPDDIVAMTYVLEQPCSPVEILAVDLKDSFVSVANERLTERLRYVVKVRNRSDQPIQSFNMSVRVTPTGGYGSSGAGVGAGTVGPPAGRDLAPGEETEISGGRDRGST